MKKLLAGLVFVVLSFCSAGVIFAANITGVSIPVNSMDSDCWAKNSGVWSVNASNLNSGIGNILTLGGSTFSLHDHYSVLDTVGEPTNVPMASRAVVTYYFDEQVIITALNVEQHQNGITKIEGFSGDSLESLSSIGDASTGATGVGFGEHQLTTFNFSTHTVAGTIFQFVITQTVAQGGYATYSARPEYTSPPTQSPVPVPSTMLLLGSGVVGLTAAGRRKRS